MNKILEKIKNLFGCRCGKKEEPKPQQAELKVQEEPKEQKEIKPSASEQVKTGSEEGVDSSNRRSFAFYFLFERCLGWSWQGFLKR